MAKKKAKTYFLVDTENTGSELSPVVKNAGSGDRVILFFTKNNGKNRLSLDDIASLTEKGTIVQAVMCKSGKNALDFQLASWLGWTARSNRDKRFVIVSNDTGYLPLNEFWKKYGVNVEFMFNEKPGEEPVIAPVKKKKKPAPPVLAKDECIKKYRKIISGAGLQGKECRDSADAVVSCINSPAEDRESNIGDFLKDKYDSKTVHKIVKRLRPVVEQILSKGPLPSP